MKTPWDFFNLVEQNKKYMEDRLSLSICTGDSDPSAGDAFGYSES